MEVRSILISKERTFSFSVFLPSRCLSAPINVATLEEEYKTKKEKQMTLKRSTFMSTL